MSAYPAPVPQPARPSSTPDFHHAYPALPAYTTHPPGSSQWPAHGSSGSSAGIAAVQPPPARSSQPSADSSLMLADSTRTTSGSLPALPSSFPELEELTSAQLQRLLNDPVALEVRGRLVKHIPITR